MRPKEYLKLAVAMAIVAGGTTTFAKEISSVRRAAIEQLQSKLGELRGSIKPKARHIYLTAGMIEQLKPIRSGENTAKAGLDVEPAALPEWLNGATQPLGGFDISLEELIDLEAVATANNESFEQLQQDISEAVNQPLPANEIDRDLVTSSTTQGTLPDTADMDTLVNAVDKMVTAQQ